MKLLNRLAGSVKIPKEYNGLTTEEIVYKAKKEYFRNKKRNAMELPHLIRNF